MESVNQTTFIQICGSMPPLRHSVWNQPFNIDESAALQWMMSQPGFKDWAWSKMRSTGRLVFDPVTGLWRGKDYATMDVPPGAETMDLA